MEEVSCYRDMLEVQAMEFLYVIPDMLSQTTGQDVWALWPVFKQYVIGLVTLEAVRLLSCERWPLSPACLLSGWLACSARP